nr:hypothetical protein [Kutzneria buriramensis]WKX08875.1 hypothetical protein Q4V64_15800 [Kutzneria buriramensis]
MTNHDEAAAVRAEHVSGAVREVGQEAVDVVSMLGQCRALLGAWSRLRDSPRRS